jgi:ribosomal protein S18 acetylase RimI-like enzyme
MRAGTLFRRFTAADGREVTLRAPRWSDLDDMLHFINSLVEEGAEIAVDEKTTREREVDWLARKLSDLEKDRAIIVVAEAGDRFVGQVEVNPKFGRSSHVGVLGISILRDCRDLGIGTELMREAERQAPRLGLRIITLEVIATNERARHVYEKVGYRAAGRIPKAHAVGDGYADAIMMAKEIEPSVRPAPPAQR